ncbi:hypothetical protein [Streptomyces sp. NPDC001068]|uniref:hypothetical protein n=1 Tax=Streptomyces sp. NPDC001068 TaxID=3364544 RepID=UPI0036B27132
MPDYNGGGFRTDGDGNIFAVYDGSSGNRADYDSWDWKQIRAAIFGLSGQATAANDALALEVSNPQSLVDAALAFYHVQKTLETVGRSLVDQAKALAGDDGPWKGTAADSFLTMMENFSNQVMANVTVLAGGSTGKHSIPNQLAGNGVALWNAQKLIADLDQYYAQRAIALGVQPMSNGLIPISQRPDIVTDLTADMRVVLKTLADDYAVTSDSIINPKPVDDPTKGGTDGDGGLGGDPLPGAGGFDAGLDAGGGIGGGLDGGLGGGDLPGLSGSPDPQSLAALSGPPDTGFDAGAGIGGGLGDGLGDLTPGDLAGFPGDPADLDGGGIGGGLDTGGFDPSALDTALNPASLAGLAGLGGLSGLGGLGGGRLGTAGDEGLDGLSAADPAAFGDLGLDDGLADGIGSGLADGLGDEPAAGAGLSARPVTSSGMPYLPGMGGMGGAGSGGAGLSAEPTDASGLLDASSEPWEGDTAFGGDEVGSELGALAGGEGLGAAGLPFMPGMGGMGPTGGARDAAGDPSDASALLDSSTGPWDAEENGDGDSDGDDVGSAEGALPGVPYLLGFGAPDAAAGAPGARRGTEGARAAEGTRGDATVAEPAAAEPAVTGTSDGAGTAAAPAPVAVGSDGLPLPGDGSTAPAVRPRPDDGEEDFSAWEVGAVGAGAFVPLLWAVPGEREGGPPSEEEGRGEAHEPWSTWQPERPAPGTAPAAAGAVPLPWYGDGEPEPEETVEEGEDEPAEETPRGIADLLVQEESAWGTVPGGPSPAL